MKEKHSKAAFDKARRAEKNRLLRLGIAALVGRCGKFIHVSYPAGDSVVLTHYCTRPFGHDRACSHVHVD